MEKSTNLIAVLEGYVASRPVPTLDAARRKSDIARRRIIDATMGEIIRDGIAGLSLRKIAAAVDVSLGNLTYHFPTKATLIEALLDDRIAEYARLFSALLKETGPDPRDQLAAIVRALVEDLRKAEIAFFPQLWAHAAVDETTWQQMHKLYDVERAVFVELIKAAVPEMPTDLVQRAALGLQAKIEGLTLFIGMGRRNEGIFADPAAAILEEFELIFSPYRSASSPASESRAET